MKKESLNKKWIESLDLALKEDFNIVIVEGIYYDLTQTDMEGIDGISELCGFELRNYWPLIFALENYKQRYKVALDLEGIEEKKLSRNIKKFLSVLKIMQEEYNESPHSKLPLHPLPNKANDILELNISYRMNSTNHKFSIKPGEQWKREITGYLIKYFDPHIEFYDRNYPDSSSKVKESDYIKKELLINCHRFLNKAGIHKGKFTNKILDTLSVFCDYVGIEFKEDEEWYEPFPQKGALIKAELQRLL